MKMRLWTAAVTAAVMVAAVRVLGAAHIAEAAMTALLSPGLAIGSLLSDGCAAEINAPLSLPGLMAMYGVNLTLYGGLLYATLSASPVLKRRGQVSKKAEKAWA